MRPTREPRAQAGLRLWCHEVLRVLGGQCVAVDQNRLADILDQQLKERFSTSWQQLFGQQHICPPYAALTQENGEEGLYEPVLHPSKIEVGPCEYVSGRTPAWIWHMLRCYMLLHVANVHKLLARCAMHHDLHNKGQSSDLYR